jgi:hypothetical protein
MHRFLVEAALSKTISKNGFQADLPLKIHFKPLEISLTLGGWI